MADESTGGTLTEVKVSEGDYIDGLTVTLKDGTSKDFPFKYENEEALETSRIAADAAAKAANEAKAAVEANEEQRKTDEATRGANEKTRKEEFAKAKQEAEDQAAEAKKAAAAAKTAKTLADDAAELANNAAGNADEATSSATEAARKANAAAEAVSVATLGISPPQLRAMVRMGRAADVLRIGDQVNSTFTWEGREYPIAYDVGHHMDGRDDDHPLVTLADGSQVPALFLVAHNALPMAVPFDSKEAVFSPDEDLEPGTYCFDIEVNYVWGTGVAGAKGTTTVHFTSAKEWPAGCQAVWNASYGAKATSLTVYDKFTDVVIETVALSEGAAGRSLGKVSEAINGPFNNLERACEGSGDYATSGLRAWLTSETSDWNVQQTAWDRPHALAGKPGFLACIPADLRAVLGAISVKTQRHQIDGGDIFEGFDRAFILSARQHYFANYLGATGDGFAAEGVPLDYCKAIAASHGRTSPYPGWVKYPELITYDLANPTVAVYRWERSAYRHAASASNAGIVGSDGNVGSTGAANGNRAVPGLPIV